MQHETPAAKPIGDRELMRLLHGELRAEHARALQALLADDGELRERYDSLALAWSGLELPPASPVPAGFADRVVETARRQRGDLSWSLAPAWARTGAAAALLVGLAVGALAAQSPGAGRGAGTVAQASGETLVDLPLSLAEAYWLNLEETEGLLEAAADGGFGEDGS